MWLGSESAMRVASVEDRSLLVDTFEDRAVVVIGVCGQALATVDGHDLSRAEAGII